MAREIGDVYRGGEKFTVVQYRLEGALDRGDVTATIWPIEGEPEIMHNTLSDWTNERLTLILPCQCEYRFFHKSSHNREYIKVIGRVSRPDGVAPHDHD